MNRRRKKRVPALRAVLLLVALGGLGVVIWQGLKHVGWTARSEDEEFTAAERQGLEDVLKRRRDDRSR